MSYYSDYKKYIFKENDEKKNSSKHAFFRLSSDEIIEAEERMNLKFPKELKEFYVEIGYGFLCNQDDSMYDRVMDPDSVASFRLGEDIYEDDLTCQDFFEEDKLVFFEVNEESFISIELEVKEDGTSSVYYFNTKIADSLKEFLNKMDESTDYYLKV